MRKMTGLSSKYDKKTIEKKFEKKFESSINFVIDIWWKIPSFPSRKLISDNEHRFHSG